MTRTFTQVSVQWQDTDSMREELDDLQVRVFPFSSEIFSKLLLENVGFVLMKFI